MALTAFMQKRVLDFICGGGGAVSSPAGRWLSWATGTPTEGGASDIAITGGTLSSRMSVVMAPANSPQGSATILSSQQGVTARSQQGVLGWNLYDGATAGANRLAYGTVTAAFTATVNSAIRMSSGSGGLTISIT